MQLFQGKTIILGAPKYFTLDESIECELKDLGFETINMSFYAQKFKYKHLRQRLECFFCRDVLGINDYKNRLKFKTNQAWLENKLENLSQLDYTLLIRPDVCPIDFINSLGMKTKKLIGYQWDGLDRYPHIHKRIGLFDRFFVFDRENLGSQSVLPITNYYLDTLSEQLQHGAAFKSLADFINKCYVPLPEETCDKYSFRNWLHYALDEGDHERLSIPCWRFI